MMKTTFYFLSAILTAGLLLIVSSAYWPEPLWWLSNIIHLSPLPFLLLPIGSVLAWAIALRSWRWLAVHAFMASLILFIVLDYGIRVPSFRAQEETMLRVMTINLGDGTQPEPLTEFIEEIQPDILVLQDTQSYYRRMVERMPALRGYAMDFQSNLGIVSRFPVTAENVVSRRVLGGYGNIAVRYLVGHPGGAFALINAHVHTPREGLEALLSGISGVPQMREITMTMAREAHLAGRLTEDIQGFILAGDLNLTVGNPMYRQNFGHLRNAFSRSGRGFGHTFHTSVYGLRIDHILTDGHWQTVDSFVGPDMGGQHRPVVAVLKRTGRHADGNEQKALRSSEKKNDVSPGTFQSPPLKTFWADTFEAPPDAWKTLGAGALALDPVGAYQGQSALRIEMTPGGTRAVAGVSWDHWPIETYPVLRLAYRIPQEMPLSLRVRTSFGDWICAAYTQTAACEDTPHDGGETFIADGQWHEMTMDMRALIQSRLPSVNGVQSIGFVLPQNVVGRDAVWLDDIRITEGP